MTNKTCECHGVSEHNPNEIDKLAKIRKWITGPDTEHYVIDWLPAAKYLLSELDKANADNERLRKALEVITRANKGEMRRIAYQALESK